MKDKIHEDEIKWLVSVYKASIDEEVTKESYEKLVEYGLTDEQIQDIYEKINPDEDFSEVFDKAWAEQAERNKFEKYTLIEMVKVFLFAPYELFKHFDSGLKELWDYNYKTKFRQRVILLILGIIFWILFAVGTYKYSEYKRIQEIENIDISDWERSIGYR